MHNYFSCGSLEEGIPMKRQLILAGIALALPLLVLAIKLLGLALG